MRSETAFCQVDQKTPHLDKTLSCFADTDRNQPHQSTLVKTSVTRNAANRTRNGIASLTTIVSGKTHQAEQEAETQTQKRKD